MQNPSKENFIAQVRAGGRLSASVLDTAALRSMCQELPTEQQQKDFPPKEQLPSPQPPSKKKKEGEKAGQPKLHQMSIALTFFLLLNQGKLRET
jgi:hypothetical protein